MKKNLKKSKTKTLKPKVFSKLMQKLSHVRAGRQFSRAEMNER